MREPARTLTGVLISRGLEYFLRTKDGTEYFLLGMQLIYRRMVGCEVEVKGIQTGIDTLLIQDITFAPIEPL